MRKLKPFLGLLVVTAVAVTLSGCGTTDSAPSGQSTSVGAAVPAAVTDLVASAAQAQPWQGPTTSPPIAKGLFVVAIPCSMASGCSRWDDGVLAAGKELGWRVQTIDPVFDPAKMNQAILQAVDLGANAIVTWTVDPTLVASSVAIARSKGIIVLSGGVGDEAAPITADGSQHEVSLHGTTQGQWIAAKACEDTNAQGKVLIVTDPSYNVLTQRVDAAKDYLAKNCPNMTVKVEQVSANDVGTVLQNKISALVQTNPDLTSLITPVDLFTTDILVALQQLSNSAIKVYSIDGDPSSIQNIADGGSVHATVGSALEWGGWASMDNVNRLAQGQPVNTDDQVPNRLITDAFIPTDSTYRGDVDYKAMYSQLWTTGSLKP
jgi:ribose transport system substrate-binding protein